MTPPLSRIVGRFLGLCVALVGVVVAHVGFFGRVAGGRGIDVLVYGSPHALLLFAAGSAGVGFVVGGAAVAAGRSRNLVVSVASLVLAGAVVLLPMEPKSTDGLLGFGFGALVLLLAAALTPPKTD